MNLKAQKVTAVLNMEATFRPDEYLEWCRVFEHEPSEEDFKNWIREEFMEYINDYMHHDVEINLQNAWQTRPTDLS